MGKIALLFLGGNVSPSDFKLAERFDFICCADSGLDSALRLGLTPDVVIGDMDSVSGDGLAYVNKKKIDTITHPPDKNFTDGELAIDFLLEKKPHFSQVKVLGLIGDRPDHVFGNFLLLKNKKNDIPIVAFSDGYKIHVFKKGVHQFSAKPGATVSLFAFREPVFVKLNNLKFKFEDTLRPFSSRCISNVTPDGSFSIEADSDILVFIQSQV